MAQAPEFVAIVLAAGQGTRMKSALPKVLHPLLGQPLLSYPIQASLDAGAKQVVAVLGHGRDQVAAELAKRFDVRVSTTLQPEQRGTGDAARCGAAAVTEHQGMLLILYGDAPLITAAPLKQLALLAQSSGKKLALITSTIEDATGYGRILRDAHGHVVGVREQKDCSAEERAMREWNPGVYAVDAQFFRICVTRLSTQNAQNELLLTDVVAMAANEGGVADLAWDAGELHGVNDRVDLARAERGLRLRRCAALGRAGVTIRDPETTFIDADVTIEQDVTIEANVQLRGGTTIASGAHVDVGCVLRDVTVHAGAHLLPYTVASSSVIGERAQVGPFAHLRAGSELGSEVHVGNFVETKKTRLARGAKANHLAYLGDGIIGERVNVGAGTIFCNYDGFQKHVTVLKDGAFIGSDSQLVAPITVGIDAYVATGTTVTQDVPDGALAIGRARQQNKEGLALRLRERLRLQAEKVKGEKR